MSWRILLLYAAALASGAFLLEWLEFRLLARTQSTELTIAIIAMFFVGIGVWAGLQLRSGGKPEGGFVRNTNAIRSLGLTEREVAVLDKLAEGQSNKEIARALEVSPNTVKTHLTHLYAKLEVNRRVQAVQKAKLLRIVP